MGGNARRSIRILMAGGIGHRFPDGPLHSISEVLCRRGRRIESMPASASIDCKAHFFEFPGKRGMVRSTRD